MLTYNREDMVSRAIESILAQTYTDFEFIIVDNGSTDRSGEIADEYAVKDNRITVIHRDKGSIGAGRNTALDAAKGEYIAFVDDDDRFDPDYIVSLYDLAINNNSDISICTCDNMGKETGSYPTTSPIIMNDEEALIELLWRKKYTNGFPAKMFKRAMFLNLRFPENVKYEDIHLMYKVIAHAKVIAYQDLPKYHVFRHNKNNSIATTISEKITPEFLDEYRGVYLERTLWLIKHYEQSTLIWRYFYWSFLISMVNKIIIYDLQSCLTYLEEMRKELYEHRIEFNQCPWVQSFEKEWMKEYIDTMSN